MKKYNMMPEREKLEHTQRCIHLPAKAVKKLEAEAKERGCSFSYVIREIIHEAVKQREFDRVKRARRSAKEEAS